MYDRLNPKALFLEHLGWINKVASITCSRHGVFGADAEDFTSFVQVKLMENDYAILRDFRGGSELKTYLAAVVGRQFASHRREERGRWRPSAEARRQGQLAIELERLVWHEGYTLGQAGEKLRTAGRTTDSDTELARLLARLPHRDPLRPRPVGPTWPLDDIPGSSNTDERVDRAKAEARRKQMMDALARAMGQLEQEDQLIFRMRFGDGYTLADVGRALGLEQKPLYRRVGRLRFRLRKLLESEGLRADDVRDLLDGAEGTG
jgi:RNA polymerase sigma factor for flagellar operon FliA